MESVYLTNAEYDYLLQCGGDSLVAVFATIRASKKDVVIKKVGKKGSLATLQSVTGLSRTTLQNHMPKLIELNLIEIHSNGNIAVRSRNWTKKHLRQFRNHKLLPLVVYNRFADTRTYSAFVRVHSRIKKQERQIEKKAKRIEVLEACSKNKRLSRGDYRIWKKLHRSGVTLDELKLKYRSNSTISNLSFHKILKDSDLLEECNKSSGKDFKRKLMRLGLISQQRITTLKYPNVKDKEFLENEKDLLRFGSLFQGSLGIYEEISPVIKIV